jgi:ABC-type glycerol-3-phosphate transport system permease component
LIREVLVSLVNFQAVFGTGNVPRYAMNSLIVATTSSILTVIGSSMAGFALAKYRFLGRRFVFLLIISVLLIPLQVLMVSVFLILKTLGWINSLIGIIVPPALFYGIGTTGGGQVCRRRAGKKIYGLLQRTSSCRMCGLRR